MNIQTANRLVALRKERGYSQEDLAAKIGVSRQAVSKWERAEASPDTDNLILLARLYRVSLDELLAVSDFPAEPESEEPKPELKLEPELEWEAEQPLPDEPEPLEAPNSPEESPDEPSRPSFFGQTAPPEAPNGGWGGNSWDKSYNRAPQIKWTHFPYPILLVIIYLVLGFSDGLWHPGWMIFLTIPFYYWLAAAVDRSRRL